MPDSPDPGAVAVEAELAVLVGHTEGLQPWRRVFHAVNGVIFALALTWFVPDRQVAIPILVLVLATLLMVDLVRLRNTRANTLFFRLLRPFASPREAQKIASSTWYVVGILLAMLLFPSSAVVPGILVLAFADPAASVLGRLLGRRRLGKGSVEGTLIFAAVAFLVLLPFVPPPVAAACAVVTALVEILPLGLDDNLTVPVTAAAMVFLLG